MGNPFAVNVTLSCSGLRKLAIQSLSRPLRVAVGRESAKWKAPKTFQVSLDRSVSLNNLKLHQQKITPSNSEGEPAFCCYRRVMCRCKPRSPARPSSSCSWPSMQGTSKFKFLLMNTEMPFLFLDETVPFRGGTRRS